MRLCPNGHEIPAYANGYCARCAFEKRNSGRFTKQRAFNPERYLSTGNDSSDRYPSEQTELPPNKKMPDFGHGAKSEQKPSIQQAANTVSFTPGMVLLGIKQLLATVCGNKITIEAILADEKMDLQKVATLINARHPFVMEVRERWFTLFTNVLAREEARVIARDFGLDGRPRAKNVHELAARCQMSVGEMERLKATGLGKLRRPVNRNALVKCVADAAKHQWE